VGGLCMATTVAKGGESGADPGFLLRVGFTTKEWRN